MDQIYVFKNDAFFDDGETVALSPMISAKHGEQVHTHEFLELVYIESGAGRQTIDGQTFSVARGDLIFINLGQTHAIEAGDMCYTNCLFKPEFIAESLSDPHGVETLLALALIDGFDRDFDHSRCVVRFRGTEFLEVQTLFSYMEREASHKERGYQFVLSGYMRVLLSKMARALERREQENAGRLNLEILQYVNTHCFGQLSLRQLAEKYFYHPNYLSTKFKEFSGMSLSAYIRERRMNEAARLLTETDLSVEAVCGAVGYSEKGHFNAAFKKHTGQTPSQYRAGKRI